MERIWTTELPQYVGQRVRLAGWLHHLRQLKDLTFLILRDGKGLAQIVIEDAELIAQVNDLHAESVLAVEGWVVAEPQAPDGIELHQPTLQVLVATTTPPPLDLFRPMIKAPLPTMLDLAPIAHRHPRHRALLRIAAASVHGFRATLRDLDFVEIQTPKIVASATESGANVFALDYFGAPAYLAQSPQLYKQMMVGVFERVFEVGPVFRAEPHDTSRHINEYVSLDVELGFVRDHTTVMQVLTRVLAGIVAQIRNDADESVRTLGITLPEVPSAIPVIHFADALELIFQSAGEDARHEPDLAPAHERWLGAWARERYGSDFLYVVGYPMVKRPFYTHPDPQRPEYSNSFDLLFRGLELVSGGQRLHRYEDYLSALERHRISPDPMSSFLMVYKHGMPPHGGFGFGLERWLARLVGAANVRETTLFPRDLHRLIP